MAGLVCSGNVRIAYVDDDGVPTGGYIGIINAVQLALTVPEPDLKQRLSKQNETFGQALDQVAFPKPMEIGLSTDDVGDAETLGWAVGGSPAAYSQTGGTITDESVTAVSGLWVPLANRSVSSVVVKDSTGVTTYTADTDYIVDLNAGFIKVLAGGTISDEASLKVSYTAAALTGQAVSVGDRTSITVRIDGDMVNLANNKRVHVVVPKAKLSPAGALDLMGTEFLVAALSGNALVVGSQKPATITLVG